MFWFFLSVLLWGSVHSLLASLQAKELFQGWLGRKFMRFYRLAYNACADMSFLPVLALVLLTKSRTLYVVQLPWSGLMILGEILVVAGLLIGFLQTDRWEFLGLRQLEGTARPAQLKTKGLYHFVRHPLYAAGLAVIW
jgi:protein-S-isoprenylcysteine O-methyltransferase Ste14